MRISQLWASALTLCAALAITSCGGGTALPQATHGNVPAPQSPAAGSGVVTLMNAGTTQSLKLPRGYTGTITIGPNSAPAGTKMKVRVEGNFATVDALHPMTSTQSSNPFPIVFGIQLPITITLPIPSFSITFPPSVQLTQGTFDVALFDPTQPVGSTNPLALGKAVVSGQTLTFTAPRGLTFTFQAGVNYSFTIAQDTGGTNAVLPITTGPNMLPLPANGVLGSPIVAATSNGSSFVQWTVIPFGPVIPFGADPSNAQGVESLIAQSTSAITLSPAPFTVTMSFNPQGGAPHAGTPATFTPDPVPTVLGPYPAQFSNGAWSFNVSDNVPFTPGMKWAFSLLTVTVCVPSVERIPCDYTKPSNALTTLVPRRSYDVYISDSSGLLGGNYSVAVTGSTPDGSGPVTKPCFFVPEAKPNGDVPHGYSDAVTTSGAAVGPGPNTEFDINSGRSSPAACTIVVSYNGKPVASENWNVSGASSSQIRRPLYAKPPVNGPQGVIMSGK